MKKTILKSLLGLSVLAFASTTSAAVIFVDFTNASSVTASPTDAFNHLGSGTAGTSLALADSVGGATTATIRLSSGSVSGNSGGSTALTGDALAAGFTQAVGDRFHFTSGAVIATNTISGLAIGTSYNFTAFGSRNAGDTRPTDYVLTPFGGTAQTLTAQPSGPVNNTAIQSFTSASSTDGTFTFSFQGKNTVGNQFGYLNALKIEAVPEPSSAMLLGSVGLLALLRRRRA